ncbi:Peptidase family M20/M25/M40 [Vibrio sp. B1FLJ16]|uniref:allantoate amidohydrolase n=1 Tax=Vibrio sp. B1FLJ16 TaxID=2751178 RepID=UPI0015F6F1D4|nr:allantoate amidohydrolase [Vibrio sp. B1FLJ16]CAD7806644.1 Peptidase family M20/M25/M40 [Vibrio sp. B1FLJ16]CAE6902694.1 Peptidase family M20/M25/M40 [Vibrio sp. B1FLJ16]
MSKIDAQHVMERADQLARFTSMQDGLKRTYLSPEHKQAHHQIGEWMLQAGLETWQDSVGNQWGRKVSSNPTMPTLIIGSHSDTVADAGKYDGNLGILLGISALEQLKNVELPFHVDVVAFADEEGTRFNSTLIGSSAVGGVFDPNWLSLKDQDDITMAQAMIEFGLSPEEVGKDSRSPDEVMAYLEVHIEQGPVLEAQNQTVGVVTGIAGAKRFQFQVKGLAGHAGTVPMGMRMDALCAVAEMITTIENYATEQSATENKVVATVGKCEVSPGSVNVIPGEVNFTLDIRSLEQAQLESACDDLLTALNAIAEQRGVGFSERLLYQASAVPCDETLQSQWGDIVSRVTESEPVFLPSGAGHDALAMVHLTSVGMLFVRCDKGISHNPLESVQEDDVAVALQCLTQMILALQERKTDGN